MLFIRTPIVFGALLALLTCPRDAGAQGLVRLASGGQLGAEFRGTWHGIRDGALSSGTDFYEWIQIPLRGELLDRRLLSYRLTLRPSFRQHSATGFPESLDGRQFGTTFSASAFSALPINLAITATRATGSSAGGFGTQTEFHNSLMQTDVTYRNRFFPMRLVYARRRSTNEFTNSPGATPIQRDLRQREFRFTGTSSKTNVAVNRILYEERIVGTELAALNATLTHTLRWGRWGGRSRLETVYQRNDQTGTFATSRRSWGERLRLQHREWLNSTFQYRQASTRVAETASTTRSLSLGVNARVHRSASVALRGATYWSSFAGGTERVTTLRPRVGLNVPVLHTLRFTASGSVGIERQSRTGDNLTTAVVDEAHDVGPSRSFVLDQPDVDVLTVIIRRGDRAFLFEEGIDYILLPLDRLLRIDIPPDSRIITGESVLVSYRHRLTSTPRGNALAADYNASLSARGFTLHHQRRLRNQNAALDATRGTGDADETQTRLTVRRPVAWGDLTVNAATVRRTSAGQTATEYSAGAGFSFPLGLSVRAATNVDWSRAVTGPARLSTVSGSGGIVWNVGHALRLDTRLDGFAWSDGEGKTQRFFAGRLGVVWRIASIETQLRYEHHRRDFSRARTTNRMTLRAVRRF